MLQKAQRLLKRQEFRRAYQRGKVVKNRNFVLYYAPNILGRARIGFSVSKKIGKAVVRNRVKRKLREAARQEIQSFAGGYDYIFIARFPVITESVANLQKQMKAKLGEIALKPRVAKKKQTGKPKPTKKSL